MKYLAGLDKKQQAKIVEVLGLLIQEEGEGLDIRPLIGKKGIMICRVGNLRILFSLDIHGEVFIESMGPRGDIYKK